MERTHIEIFAALAAPFTIDETRTRSQAGREFQYVTARTVMNRLDEVLGPANWWDEYTPIENAIVCKLTVQLPDGDTLTKCDAGGFTNTADTSDYEKSGFSDAFKRAAVKFGVARYLYGDGVPRTIRDELNKARAAEKPAPPAPALTVVAPDAAAPPKDGRALFAYAQDAGLTHWFTALGRDRGFPAMMKQWSDGMIKVAWAAHLAEKPTAGRPRNVQNGRPARAGSGR